MPHFAASKPIVAQHRARQREAPLHRSVRHHAIDAWRMRRPRSPAAPARSITLASITPPPVWNRCSAKKRAEIARLAADQHRAEREHGPVDEEAPQPRARGLDPPDAVERGFDAGERDQQRHHQRHHARRGELALVRRRCRAAASAPTAPRPARNWRTRNRRAGSTAGATPRRRTARRTPPSTTAPARRSW